MGAYANLGIQCCTSCGCSGIEYTPTRLPTVETELLAHEPTAAVNLIVCEKCCDISKKMHAMFDQIEKGSP